MQAYTGGFSHIFVIIFQILNHLLSFCLTNVSDCRGPSQTYKSFIYKSFRIQVKGEKM